MDKTLEVMQLRIWLNYNPFSLMASLNAQTENVDRANDFQRAAADR